MINHFEFHKELTRKDELVTNLKAQLQYECENLFDFTPITFQINIPDGKQPSLEHFFKKFLSLYYVLNQTKEQVLFLNKQKPPHLVNKEKEEEEKKEEEVEVKDEEEKLGQTDLSNVNARDFNFLSFAEIYNRLHNITVQKGSSIRAVLLRESSTKYVMPYCHFIGGNYWILKTTYQNRGNGIYVFKSISQLISIILSYIKIDATSSKDPSNKLKPLFGQASTESQLKTNLALFSGPIQVPRNMSFII